MARVAMDLEAGRRQLKGFGAYWPLSGPSCAVLGPLTHKICELYATL